MKRALQLDAALLGVTTSIVVALLFSSPALAQITVTNATFPVAGDTLRMAIDNLPAAGMAVFTPPGGGQTWNLSGLQADATQNFIYRPASEGSVSAQVPGAELVTGSSPSSPLGLNNPSAEEYYNVTATRFELQAYYGIAFDLVANALFDYNPPVLDRHAPMNFFDINQSSSGVLEKFLPSAFSPALIAALPVLPDSLRYRVAIQRLDVVDAWGSLSIPGGTYDVLREKRTQYQETRLDAKVPPLGWLDITDVAIQAGFDGLGVDTSVFYSFHNNVEKEIIASVALNTAQNAATRALFKYNTPTVVDPILSIDNVTLNEGNTGTTTFSFTVSLSAPAGAGGVTFDIATADGTANAPDDYTAKSLTGQTIPAGSSTYTFSVAVNGDLAPEPDETFLVNVTNLTGALVGDLQGLGSIVSEDFGVTGSTPASGSVVAAVPVEYVIDLSLPYDPVSVQASDFTVDGIPAHAFMLIGPTRLAFLYSSAPFANQGLHAMSIPAGALVALAGGPAKGIDGHAGTLNAGYPIPAFFATFRYDAVLLQVISTVPPAGGSFDLPRPFTYDVHWNEPVDPVSVATADLALTGIAGAFASAVSVLPGNTTLRFTLDGIATSASGVLTASIAAGEITDVFGNPCAAFTADYGVDAITPPQWNTAAGSGDQSVQYSDRIVSVQLSSSDDGATPLTIASTWTKDGGPASVGLPSGLSLGAAQCQTNPDQSQTCSWTLSGQVLQQAGVYGISFTTSDGSATSAAFTVTLTVSAENTSISFKSTNPTAVQVSAPGGSSPSFNLAVDVREFDNPDNVTGDAKLAGDINQSVVSVVLVPVGLGSNVSPISSASVVAAGLSDPDSPYDYDVRTLTCSFGNVPVNTYAVAVTVNGGYYAGSNEDVLTIFDPSLGSTTGGGWIYWPGTANTASGYLGDRTNFGFNVQYNKKTKQTKGGALVIRHLPNGSVVRLKSNAMSALSVGTGTSGSTTFGWANFTGKATYQPIGAPDPLGNYDFITYVEDRGEPGSSDRFWVRVTKAGVVQTDLSLPTPGSAHAVTIGGGNIVVPQGSKRNAATPSGEPDLDVPAAFAMGAVMPNPFRTATTLEFQLPVDADAHLVIYDVTGREVARLVDRTLPAGRHQATWKPDNIAGGIYFARLTAGTFTKTTRLLLLK